MALSLAPAVLLCLISVPVRPSYHHGNLLLINNAAAMGDSPGPEETQRLNCGERENEARMQLHQYASTLLKLSE